MDDIIIPYFLMNLGACLGYFNKHRSIGFYDWSEPFMMTLIFLFFGLIWTSVAAILSFIFTE
jgi:hypothetical protein